MRQASLGLIAAQHAGDLGGTRFAGYLVQMRLGNIAWFLADNIMLVGHDGDLRQVGYDNHLMRRGEICQHAREWISPMTVMYIAERLASTYETDPRVRAILDRAEFIFVPVVNTDGYVYTWTTERFWRKNRRNNGGGSYGVDLNRNWGYQ